MFNSTVRRSLGKLALRFGIRLLFALLVITSVGMAWLVREQAESLREHRVAETLRGLGLSVRFANHYHDPRRTSNDQPGWRTFIGNVAGPRAVAVIGESDQAPLAELELVAELKQLRQLHLADVSATDLRPIAKLSHLQYLGFGRSSVRDLSPLASLSELEELSLSYSQVNDLSPLAGLPRLRVIHLEGTPIDDLSPLADLPSLDELHLQGTSVSQNEIEVLQRELPKCRIVK